MQIAASINKVPGTQPLPFVPVSFLAASRPSQLRWSCDRDHMVGKAENVYSLEKFADPCSKPSAEHGTEWKNKGFILPMREGSRSSKRIREDLFARVFSVTVISAPAVSCWGYDIRISKTPPQPAFLNLRHFWGHLLIYVIIWKFPEMHEWMGWQVGRNCLSPAPKYKATSSLSSSAQVTRCFYT